MLNTVIYESKFVWDDVLTCMDEKSRNYFLKLPVEIKQKIIDDKTHSIRKMLEYGLMHDWVLIMETAIENADLFTDMEAYDGEE